MRMLTSKGLAAGLVSITSAAFLHPTASIASQPLSTAEINELVPGATVNIDTPLDVVLPIRFNPDGTVSGTAGKLEFYLKSQTDKGRWWVADNKLCQKWRRWFDAKVTCLSLERKGEKFAWVRDDGTKGTASIVGRAPVMVAEAAAQPETKAASLVEKVTAALTPSPPGPAGLGAPEPAKGPVAVEPPKAVSLPVPAAAPKPAVVRQAAPAPRPAPRIATAQVQPQGQSTAASNVRASGGILYRVVNVARDDTLNIRDEPGQHGRVIATVRPNAHGIILTGSCNGYWCPVLAGNASGWVNRYYLSLQPMMASAR